MKIQQIFWAFLVIHFVWCDRIVSDRIGSVSLQFHHCHSKNGRIERPETRMQVWYRFQFRFTLLFDRRTTKKLLNIMCRCIWWSVSMLMVYCNQMSTELWALHASIPITPIHSNQWMSFDEFCIVSGTNRANDA